MEQLSSTIISALALAVSILSALYSFRLQRLDSRRSTRDQLSESINDLIRLNAENNTMWLVPPEQRDYSYYQKQGSITQTAVAIARQAVYLVEQQPGLATDIEYYTIAQGLVMAGDSAAADDYWKKAISAAPNSFYKIVNTRSYADFLFNQGKHETGRSLYQNALAMVDNDTDHNKYTNGFTYQMWMVSESNHRFWEEADGNYNRGRRIFESISNPYLKEGALAAIEQARHGSEKLRTQGIPHGQSPAPMQGINIDAVADAEHQAGT